MRDSAPVETHEVMLLLLVPEHLSEFLLLRFRQRLELSCRHVQREVDLAKG
jgi:hypothetical protein